MEDDRIKQLTVDDFDQICRICLADTTCINLRPLMPATIQILRGITQVKIENQIDDKLPRNICTNCSDFLQDVSIFGETCKSNEGILRRVLEHRETDQELLLKQLESEDEDDNGHYVGNEEENFENWEEAIIQKEEQEEEKECHEIIEEDSDDDNKPLVSLKDSFKLEQQKENNNTLNEAEKNNIKFKRKGPLKNVRKKRAQYLKHQKEQSESKIPVCSSCSTTFTSKAKLCSHYKENESCRPSWFEVFYCTICKKDFSTERRRDEHMNIHTGETPYVCTYCGKSFQLYTAHYKHVFKHRLALGEVELKPGYTERRVKLHLQCDQCPKIFASRSGFANHLLMHKGIKVVYKRRPKVKKEGDLIKAKEKNFLCNHCGKGFRTRMQLEGHIRSHTGENSTEFQSARDNQSEFYDTNDDNRSTCSDINDINESYINPSTCDYIDDISQLCNISQSTCDDIDDINQSCDISQSTCDDIDDINQSAFDDATIVCDSNSDTSERPFPCSFCNKVFRTKGSLKIHEMNHMGTTPKRYVCEVCNKPFALKAHFEVHRRTHTGEKPFACNFCGKCFNYQGTLKIHMRLHTGETPYVCPVCKNRYHDRSALNKHQKKQGHEGEAIIEEKLIKMS